uniref:Post-GPI attachment to proteins factor 5 n=1 Tax=Macaca nemestrina TaxID=9545 RepID=A0A2K6C7E0_MACNE
IVFAVLLFCEFLIYYLVIFWCNWPEVKTTAYDGEQAMHEPVLEVMSLADTYLLGEFLGHWLDKLRRKWQVERVFQTALWLLQPEVVFILEDAFDEGKWSTPEAWADDVEQFQKMFRHPSHVQLKVVAGNHDTGFHYEMNTYEIEQIEKVLISERLFSMALKEDSCGICSEAEAELIEVSYRLNCSRERYPLYWRSDANCSGEDVAPPEEKNIPLKENYDVLSWEASQKLLCWFQLHLDLSSHMHSTCEVHHGGRIPELSFPSFSWRNRNNPSFTMGSITPTDYALSRCHLPREDVVLIIYCGAVGFLVVLTLTDFELLASPFLSGLNLLRKHKTR